MGVLRIDHPDVKEFITAKRTPGRWNNFNVSVGVPMRSSKPFCRWPVELVHPPAGRGFVGAHQRADGLWVYPLCLRASLWDTIMKSGHDFAEPGILFLDRINEDNNLHYCEDIAATNPCGEQPLPSVRLLRSGAHHPHRFVRHPLLGGGRVFDFDALTQVVACRCVRSTTCWT